MQYPCLKFFKETVALIQTGQFTKPGEKSLGIMDIILKDLRTAHSGRSESALGDPIYDPIRMLKDAMKEYQNFRGSPAEKRMMLFCKHNDIPYAQLTDEEKAALLRIMGKSRMMKGGVSRRGKR